MDGIQPRGGAEPSRRPGEQVAPPSWADYWAFARVRLKLTKPEFYALTLREFVDLQHEWILARYELQQAIALLRVDVMNFSMCHPERPVQITDLLKPPPRRHAAPPEPRRRMTSKRRRAVAHELAVMFAPFVKET